MNLMRFCDKAEGTVRAGDGEEECGTPCKKGRLCKLLGAVTEMGMWTSLVDGSE